MATYEVQVPFWGSIRGYKVFLVEADSAKEAIEDARDGHFIDEESHIVRDDSSTDWCDAAAEEVE